MSNQPTPQNPTNHTMSSREIATLCSKQHFNVVRDIKKTLTEAEIDVLKFEAIYLDTSNRKQTEYCLPRFECDLVVSGYSVKYRAAIIRRWHELEIVANKPALTDEEIVLQALSIQSGKVKALEHDKQILVDQVDQLLPQSEALARIADTTGNLCITDAAKVIQVRPKELFGWMSEHKWIYRRQGTGWIGFQNRLTQGVLQHKVVTVVSGGMPKVKEQVLVTPKGLTLIATAFAQAETIH